MSIFKEADGVYKIRWREGGRQKSLRVHGAKELAKKIGCEQEFVGPPIYATFLNATSSVRVATIRCALSSR